LFQVIIINDIKIDSKDNVFALFKNLAKSADWGGIAKFSSTGNRFFVGRKEG